MIAVTALAISTPGSAQAASFTPPPVNADFDYQINGGYTPPPGVTVVSRDWKDSPAQGLYNICYVNAFQTQKIGEVDGPADWDQNLLLKDANGETVIDEAWREAILDITTDAKRQAIANKINGQIDTCASKGFNALELDNFDTYSRDVVAGKITEDDAQAFMRLLSSYGHSKGLAVGQKNTVELAPNRVANGLDFAVAEECGDPSWNECGKYISAFGNNVIMIEYTDAGMANACQYADRVSVVQRDVAVLKPGETDEDGNTYVRKTC
ncbi:endo alpha-1,4 polygalactosaminidase [Streptomyces sp. NPDC048636]|uniref:endo alpha-1,4 polygalactosaminidase n=1 Tax=Streptomyces sp. NPDC048636 TaxID=3155762 RepID=UPI00343BCDBC